MQSIPPIYNYWNEYGYGPVLHQGPCTGMLLVKLIVKLQPLIAFALFVTFIAVFGWPALTTFIKYEVFIKESHLNPEPLPSPAVTICMEPVQQLNINKNIVILEFPGSCLKGVWGTTWQVPGQLDILVLLYLQYNNYHCGAVLSMCKHTFVSTGRDDKDNRLFLL